MPVVLDFSTKVAIAVPVAVIGTSLLVLFGCWIRRCRDVGNTFSYDKVSHELDEEEIEFKNMLESQHGYDIADEIDDSIFSDTGSSIVAGGHGPEADFTFDDKDVQQLDMIEKLRNNLISEAEIDIYKDEGEDIENDHIRL
mmetsp:Transcript_25180/g.41957  ORF Transcript_25180/g.41957 Transcript_25180/m.41957 type:complete len:141 (+) Transcript_25180:70-492(+)